MKNRVKLLGAVLMVAGLAVGAQAADILRVAPVAGQPYCAVDSAWGQTTNKVVATNGYYPVSITAQGVVTNHVVIPVNGQNLSIQFCAASLNGANVAQLTLYQAVRPPALVMNTGSVGYGMGGWTNAWPMTPFAKISLATSGSVGEINSTNVTFTPTANSSTLTNSCSAIIGALPYLIIENIGSTGATYPLTNYSVWVNSR